MTNIFNGALKLFQNKTHIQIPQCVDLLLQTKLRREFRMLVILNDFTYFKNLKKKKKDTGYQMPWTNISRKSREKM